MYIVKFSKAVIAILLFSSLTYSQWFQLNSGVDRYLDNIVFVSANIGYCSGDGVFLKTTNAGLNWVSIPIDTNYSIWDLHFFDENTGVGLIYQQAVKTTNGGNNWFVIHSDSVYWLWDISVVSSQIYYLSGRYGYVNQTTDGGNTWNYKFVSSPYDIRTVYFTSMNTGYLGSNDYGIIFKTTNGGANYSFYYINPDSCCFTSLIHAQFTSDNVGYMFSDSGRVLKTVNAGQSWTIIHTNYVRYIGPSYFINDNTGYIIAHNPGVHEILKTVNGVNSWTVQNPGVNSELASLFFTDANTGYAAGAYGVIIKTTNGGEIGIMPISNEIPSVYSLSQNYPNPFNPTTIIKFNIPLSRRVPEGRGVFVRLIVFDIQGKEVHTLVNENLQIGKYEVTWDATGFSSGVYFYKIETPDFVQIKKMLLVK